MADDGPARIKSYHDEGFRYINEALRLDEQGDGRQALQLYRKGVRSLITGYSVYCRGTGPKYDAARNTQEKMKLAKEQVQERITALSPQASGGGCSDDKVSKNGAAVNGVHESLVTATSSQSGPWEDVNELLVLEDGVKMFFVSEQGHVTTIAQPQSLRAYQFVKYEEGCPYPPAFLQCSGWMFPMVPKRSPVLNTEPHTYMFPDITIDITRPASAQPQGKFASVGLIINPHITSSELSRFERILRCYTDYHHYTPTTEEYNDLQTPGPTSGEGRSHHAEAVAFDPSTTTVAVRPSAGTVAVRPSAGTIATREQAEQEISWGEKVSKGIAFGAELIAWGLVKGAQVGSHLVHKGGVTIRGNLRPNETPAEVDEKVQENIRHVKSVAGVACQVSSTVVSAVAALTAELGKKIAPVIMDQGGKMLPESVKKKTNDENGEKMMKEAVKVAVSGAQGFASVYQSLEMSWRMLYNSLQLATVETVDHKYGSAAGEATNNSLGALGFALQTAWNVDNLGVKALAKRTAKDAGKEVIKEAEKKYVSTDTQLARQ